MHLFRSDGAICTHAKQALLELLEWTSSCCVQLQTSMSWSVILLSSQAHTNKHAKTAATTHSEGVAILPIIILVSSCILVLAWCVVGVVLIILQESTHTLQVLCIQLLLQSAMLLHVQGWKDGLQLHAMDKLLCSPAPPPCHHPQPACAGELCPRLLQLGVRSQHRPTVRGCGCAVSCCCWKQLDSGTGLSLAS